MKAAKQFSRQRKLHTWVSHADPSKIRGGFYGEHC